MKVFELLKNNQFKVNAPVKIMSNGELVGFYPCPVTVLNSNITDIEIDNGYIVITCDMKLKEPEDEPPVKLDISKMLTVSSAHVSEETFEALSIDELLNEIMLPIYTKNTPDNGSNFGLYIYLDQTCLAQGKIPNDLKPLIELALKNKCDVICLDSDGPELENLPLYNW